MFQPILQGWSYPFRELTGERQIAQQRYAFLSESSPSKAEAVEHMSSLAILHLR
jgi:hypothetical protein